MAQMTDYCCGLRHVSVRCGGPCEGGYGIGINYSVCSADYTHVIRNTSSRISNHHPLLLTRKTGMR
jgi:hypothetical protein